MLSGVQGSVATEDAVETSMHFSSQIGSLTHTNPFPSCPFQSDPCKSASSVESAVRYCDQSFSAGRELSAQERLDKVSAEFKSHVEERHKGESARPMAFAAVAPLPKDVR